MMCEDPPGSRTSTWATHSPGGTVSTQNACSLARKLRAAAALGIG